MSKIQKALQRIQTSKKGSGKFAPIEVVNNRPEAPSETAECEELLVSKPHVFGSAGRERVHFDIDSLRFHGLVPELDKDVQLVTSEFKNAALSLGEDLAHDGENSGPVPSVVLVTSVEPAAGRSFVSINLAMALAGNWGGNVALIDGDHVSTDITESLSLSNVQGLADYLMQDTPDLDDYILPTTIKKLGVVPAGRRVAAGEKQELPQDCGRIAEEIARRHPGSIVVIDAPRIEVLAKEPALFDYASAILVVAPAGQIQKTRLQRAVESLGARVPIHLILNRVPFHPH